jgi:hypothetical protein
MRYECDMILDSDGTARVRFFDTNETVELLARFFQTEVGGPVSHCDRLIQAVEDVDAGTLQEWSINGNCFHVVITPGQATLSDLFLDSQSGVNSISIDSAIFLTLLRSWRSVIRKLESDA